MLRKLSNIGWLSNDVILVGGGTLLYLVAILPILGVNNISIVIGAVWVGLLLIAAWV